MKFLFSENDKKTEFKADYGQLLTYFKETPKHKIAEAFQINGSKIMSSCLNDSYSWKGGYYQDVFKDVVIDTKQAYDVKPVKNMVNRRKRFLSEHDGDYVHERRFDINFMESARREKIEGSNLIKINANASFSAAINSDDINEYAKQVCEVVNYFESMGRSVELNLFYKQTDMFNGAPATTVFLTVKRPDKYLSKADIYRAFSSLFFRHIGFCCLTYMAEANRKVVNESLGYPVADKDRITITETEITIHGMTKQMMKKILDAQKKAG